MRLLIDDKQRFLRLTQLLRKPLYDRITIAEFLILWMMCFACHIMSFFCNNQLGIVRRMVKLPLTYAGGSKTILMKLFDFFATRVDFVCDTDKKASIKDTGTCEEVGVQILPHPKEFN